MQYLTKTRADWVRKKFAMGKKEEKYVCLGRGWCRRWCAKLIPNCLPIRGQSRVRYKGGWPGYSLLSSVSSRKLSQRWISFCQSLRNPLGDNQRSVIKEARSDLAVFHLANCSEDLQPGPDPALNDIFRCWQASKKKSLKGFVLRDMTRKLEKIRKISQVCLV